MVDNDSKSGIDWIVEFDDLKNSINPTQLVPFELDYEFILCIELIYGFPWN